MRLKKKNKALCTKQSQTHDYDTRKEETKYCVQGNHQSMLKLNSEVTIKALFAKQS